MNKMIHAVDYFTWLIERLLFLTSAGMVASRLIGAIGVAAADENNSTRFFMSQRYFHFLWTYNNPGRSRCLDLLGCYVAVRVVPASLAIVSIGTCLPSSSSHLSEAHETEKNCFYI